MKTDLPTFYNVFEAEKVFCENPLFQDKLDGELPSAFRRPLGQRIGWVGESAVSSSSPATHWSSQAALYQQRLLTSIYHTDFIYLPNSVARAEQEAADRFYSDDLSIAGAILRPRLERILFGGVQQRVRALLRRNSAEVQAYFTSLPERQRGTESAVVRACLESVDPVRAVKNLLIQFSIDFLSEGSAIARSVMGCYGPIQSSLFRIFMDEYGGGAHPKKHSTLYETLLTSHGLATAPYTYWSSYLPTAFAVPNLFQFLAGDHRRFFQYVGAVFYAETTYYHLCGQLSHLLKTVFGGATESAYFDEHFHVDQTHSAVAYDELVAPLLERYGDVAGLGILDGYELFAETSRIADEDFILQLKLIDAPVEHTSRAEASRLHAEPTLERLAPHATISRIAEEDLVCELRQGDARVHFGFGAERDLSRGDQVWVPKGRLYQLTSQRNGAALSQSRVNA